jgi:hypothetical protein
VYHWTLKIQSVFAGSFAGLGFLSWYLAGKIRVFDQRGHVAKLCMVILPLLLAAMVGVSRVDDYWHHWQDVFAGGILGRSRLLQTLITLVSPEDHTVRLTCGLQVW